MRTTCRHGTVWEWVDFAWPNMAGRGMWSLVKWAGCDCHDPDARVDVIARIAEAAED